MKRSVVLSITLLVVLGFAFNYIGESKNAEIVPPEPAGIVALM